MFRLVHDLIKQFEQSLLLRSHELGITNNVEKEHVGDFQLDFFFRFSGHSGSDLAQRELNNLLLPASVSSKEADYPTILRKYAVKLRLSAKRTLYTSRPESLSPR